MQSRFHVRKVLAGLSIAASFLMASPAAFASYGGGYFPGYFNRGSGGNTNIDVNDSNTALANSTSNVDVQSSNDGGGYGNCRHSWWNRCGNPCDGFGGGFGGFHRPQNTNVSVHSSSFAISSSSSNINVSSNGGWGGNDVSVNSDNSAIATSSSNVDVNVD